MTAPQPNPARRDDKASAGAASGAGTKTRVRREPNRWAVLALLGVAQLMVTLDVTIVNIALPSAQRALHFSTDSRQWIITAYALAFGSLLLLGGKLGDLFGRKPAFVAGLVGFSVASAIGGEAQSFAMLVAARALQGAFGALLAPSALSLLTVSFAGSPDRPKAFGIFGAITAGGASFGLLLGGVLTQMLSWRWCLYVNLAIAVPTTTVAIRLLVNHRPDIRPRIDVPGVVAISSGLFALVYGFSNAESHSWSALLTVVALCASAVLISTFVAIERRVRQPLLPLSVVSDRARGGAFLSIAFAGSGPFAVFLFLSFYLQRDLNLSPVMTGLAFLPLTGAVGITATFVQTRVVAHTGAKPLVMGGMSLGVIAMVVFTQLSTGSAYVTGILPGLILLGVGMGCIFAPAFSTATLGVSRQTAGVASAMVNTSQQVGGSIGVSILSTVYASAVAGYADHVAPRASGVAAMIHGDTEVFVWAAGMFGIGLILALVVLPVRHGRDVEADAGGLVEAPDLR